jgi:hypothetical protein
VKEAALQYQLPPVAELRPIATQTRASGVAALIGREGVTVWDADRIHDSPEPELMVVPSVTPVPLSTMPMASVPDTTDWTVSVVLKIVPIMIVGVSAVITAAGAVNV